MRALDFLRERWGSGIRPSVRIHRDNSIERWDGEGEGRAYSIAFEAFGITGILFIGPTPRRGQ